MSNDEYFNMGAYGRPITTNSDLAQTWFDQGLVWSYSFNHDEAYRCFEQAIVHDPACAMAYWDLERSAKNCYDAAKKASGLVNAETTPVERALIKAIQFRFPNEHPPSDFAAVDRSYAGAMEEAYREFGTHDMDVVALYVDSLMHTALRKMFHVKTGLPIQESPVHKVRKVFDIALQHPASETHPGILHLWIHFMEMSCTPGVALPAADKLRHLVPDGGHMHHMPTHLDVLVGDYRRSIDSNTAAVIADEKYLAKRGGKNFYSFYRLHNYHSLIYAGMLAGQLRVVRRALDQMEVSITDDLLRVESPPLADWMEFFKAVRVHAYIRFGLWEEILALPLPADQALYCVTTTMMHYGRGIAWAALGNVEQADRERELYHAAVKTVPPSRKDFPNLIHDVFKVATAMLDGEIEYRRGDYPRAFQSLREAINHDDALRYTEPWGWMVPTRHAYAALSLEQGRVEEAAQAYAEDLGLDDSLTRAHQHPNNIWALHGYHECLNRLGRNDEARIIKQQLDLAQQVADVEIKSSCFCRLDVMTVEQDSCCGKN